jgi:hypothetical protein
MNRSLAFAIVTYLTPEQYEPTFDRRLIATVTVAHNSKAVDSASMVPLVPTVNTTPNSTPTFSVEVFTDLAASSVMPPPNPLHYVPSR